MKCGAGKRQQLLRGSAGFLLFHICSYWLGDINKIDDNSLWHPSFVNWIGNTQTFRSMATKKDLAAALYRHTHESMHCLKSFLPKYYAKMSELGKVNETSADAERQLLAEQNLVQQAQDQARMDAEILAHATALSPQDVSFDLGGGDNLNSKYNSLPEDDMANAGRRVVGFR
jgi:hypothetical protein